MNFFGLLQWWGRQRWIRFGIRDRVLRLLVAPEKLRPQDFTIDFFDWRYEGNLSSYVDWTVFFYGAYELGLLKLLAFAADRAGPGAVFLDIGANVGQHSLYMSRHVGQVHAFEPWPVAYQRLQRMLTENHVDNVFVHPVALGEIDTEKVFFAPAGSNHGTGSFCPGVNFNEAIGNLAIRRGDDLIGELGLQRIDLIKIDTEGFEVEVLTGLRESLRQYGPIVVVEIAPIGHSQQSSFDFDALFPPDWQIFSAGSHPERYELQPCLSIGEKMITVVAGPKEKLSRLFD